MWGARYCEDTAGVQPAEERPGVQHGKVNGGLQSPSGCGCLPACSHPVQRADVQVGHVATRAMTAIQLKKPPRPDGRTVARENEMRTLRALHRFGWLRTRDVAALVFSRWASKPATEPSLAPIVATNSGIRMAQRTLRRLKEARMALSSLGPDGSTVYALAGSGTRALQAAGIEAASGKDAIRGISSGYFRHRCISNELAIAGIVQGFRVATEREIARGLWAGGESGIAGKKPDVLWRNRNEWIWLEVQRSRHNSRDYALLLSWLAAMAARLDGRITESATLHRIVFVCTAAFEAKLRRDVSTKGIVGILDSGLLTFERSLYKFEGTQFL